MPDMETYLQLNYSIMQWIWESDFLEYLSNGNEPFYWGA